MDQARTTNKILFEMKPMELINMEKVDEVRKRLEWCYVAGYEEARKELLAHNCKKVEQYNRAGELIEVFDSVEIAAKRLGINRDVIDNSVHGRTEFTKKGHYFRYADKKKKAKLRIA